jgi:hypothetical protein
VQRALAFFPTSGAADDATGAAPLRESLDATAVQVRVPWEAATVLGRGGSL